MRLTLAHESVEQRTFRSLERLVRHVPAYDLAYTDALAAADTAPRAGIGVGTNAYRDPRGEPSRKPSATADVKM